MANVSLPQDIIAKLNMRPLPDEGGFYAETYRSPFTIELAHGTRSAGTAIYYMITAGNFSALHRLKHDEIFHFYQGDPVTILLIARDGTSQEIILGQDIIAGQLPQAVVPAGVWQGTRIKLSQLGWSLLGTTMSPGFEFADFELADRKLLTAEYPHLANEIANLTRMNP
jgi:uncharacterized protein